MKIALPVFEDENSLNVSAPLLMNISTSNDKLIIKKTKNSNFLGYLVNEKSPIDLKFNPLLFILKHYLSVNVYKQLWMTFVSKPYENSLKSLILLAVIKYYTIVRIDKFKQFQRLNQQYTID